MTRLYLAVYQRNGEPAWGEIVLPDGSEVLSIDSLDVPGRGSTLGLVVKRDDGVYLETLNWGEVSA